MKIKHILKYACSWLFTALCLAEQLWLCVFLCAHFHVSLCEDEHRHQESEFAVGHTYFKCSHDNARHDADHHSHNLPEIKLQQDENGDFSLLNAGEGFDIENGTIVAVGDEKTRERVALLETKVDDLLYEPISITSFTVNPSTAEKGASVSQPYCSWKLNKKATAITLDGESVSPELGGFSLMRYNIKENTTFTLKVTDERGHSETKTATLSFMNGVYYGVSSIPETLDSAFIRTLTKTLRSNKLPSFTVNAGAGQYIWYCLPKAYGACSFTVGGFSGGFALVDTISYKNAYGHTEDYYVYRSDHESLGQTAVTVA